MSGTIDDRVADMKSRARRLIIILEGLSSEFNRKKLPEYLKEPVANVVKSNSAIARGLLDAQFPGSLESTPANENAMAVVEGMLARLEAGVEPLRKQIEALW